MQTMTDILLHNLTANADATTNYKQQLASMNGVASVAYDSTTQEHIRTKLQAAIQNARQKAYCQLRSETNLNIPVNQQISALKDVPLADKRKLLDAMPIITVPIGAAFLGVAEADLHDINSQSRGVFGDIYMGRHCNSMNELVQIAKNPGWLRFRPHLAPALMTPDPEMLYSMTYVDISTATSYTNMTVRELQMHAEDIYRFHRCHFTYRVSDLEEIRAVKLKAHKQ
jgi:hypothetical protein